MNNKDFTTELSQRLEKSPKEISELITTMVSGITQQLQEGNKVTIHDFGTFEVKKKGERISVNPLTKERFLVPPKLVMAYHSCDSQKERFNAD